MRIVFHSSIHFAEKAFPRQTSPARKAKLFALLLADERRPVSNEKQNKKA
jgi:hypothetical protein